MQSVIIMGLVGFMFASVISLVSTIFVGTVEYRELTAARVSQMFEDVEFAITNTILNQEVDLKNYPELSTNSNDLSELVGITSWSYDELMQDPWDVDIRVISALKEAPSSVVYADATTGGGFALINKVVAPIWSFALISPGPNGVLDTTLVGPFDDYMNILNIEPLAGSDDIIHTFSTQNAMLKIWNELYTDIESKVLPAITNVYKQQQEIFQPVIDFAYNDLLANADLDEASDFVDSWQEYGPVEASTILPVPFASANMLIYSTQAQVFGIEPFGADGTAHPSIGGSFTYPDISNIGVEDIGLDELKLKWDPFWLSMAPVPDFNPPADEAEMAKFASRVQINLNSFLGTGGNAVEEWQLDFSIVASGAD